MSLRYLVASVLCLVIPYGGYLSAQDPKGKSPPTEKSAKEEKKDFTYADVDYFHRFTEGNLHEYTPKDQEDLEKWKDMVSLVTFPTATDGDGVAAAANGTLELYKKNRALVLRTNSVPRTEKQPAEHFVAVYFIRPEFAEIVFARFKLHEGKGMGIIYSHRIYGEPEEVGKQAGAWIKENGEAIEKKLMAFDAVPALTTAPKK